VRGGDQFSYAVMAEQLLSHGSYGTFMIYPPGFPALTARRRRTPAHTGSGRCAFRLLRGVHL